MNINTVVAKQRRELEHTIKDMRTYILYLERVTQTDDFTEQQMSRKLKLLNDQFNLLTTLLTLLNSKGE